MSKLRVGGREIDVDTSPMKAAAANFRTSTLVQPRDGCMVLRPSGGMRLFAALFLVIGLVVMAVAVGALVAVREQALWFLVAFGTIFAAAGLAMLLLPRRNEFDRDAGQWTFSHFLSSTARPLTDILAVQLIDGGYQRSGDGPDYYTYQLNLVLDDAAESRRCLSNHANRNATRADAERLAEFLGVPLLDHM